MLFLEDAINPCADSGCIYYEWNIPSMPDIRFIASGYEDGIDYAFYEVDECGDLVLL